MTTVPSMRTDRLGLLLDQLESSWQLGRARLEGLTDAEYRWEPWPDMWSLRRRGEREVAVGPGEWVLDWARTDPDPPPLTTIAWRMAHLTNGTQGRWEWTSGPRRTAPDDVVDFAPTAAGAITQLTDTYTAWHDGVAALSDEQLDTVGFGQYPWGLDPHLPIVSIVWWVNREFIHHLAEIALLRDLYLRMG